MTSNLQERFQTTRFSDRQLKYELQRVYSALGQVRTMANLLPFVEDHKKALEAELAERQGKHEHGAGSGRRHAVNGNGRRQLEKHPPLAIEGPPGRESSVTPASRA